jgi:hypothetical protein
MRPGPKVKQVGKGPYPPHGPNPGRTYRFYEGEMVRYPFGYGAKIGSLEPFIHENDDFTKTGSGQT